MKILMTGATGLVGQRLGVELIRLGHELICVSRNIKQAMHKTKFSCQWIEADLNKQSLPDTDILNDVELVIHLAGENIAAARWSEKQKQDLYVSRVQSSQNLLKSFKQAPATVISASAVGIYGVKQLQQPADESQPAAEDFLAQLCVQWENVFNKQAQLWKQTRFVQTRFGVVLSAQGGALPKMLPAFRMNLGGALGDGQQIMSWIHIEDLVQALLHTIQMTSLHSAVNFVAPYPVTNLNFTRSLNHHLGKWNAPAVPAFILKLALGEMSQILLTGVAVSSKKLQQSGFQFKYPEIDGALAALCAEL